MISALSSQTWFFLSLLSLLAGALGSLAFSKHDRLANWWGNCAAILASLLGLMAALPVLFFGSGFTYSFALSFPGISVSFAVDQLSAFFIAVISLISLFVSLFGLGYVQHYYGKYNLGVLGFFYNTFIAGMLMVVSAHNAVFFLIVWEIMSLASYFLVVYEHKSHENVRAGFLYFVMTHVGTAAILLAFLLLYGATGSFDFGVMKERIGEVSPMLKNIVFILALIGFGTKAGIIPLHIWLPSAHPAAPSHVSALMSGVMIKTGIYMCIRIFIDVMGSSPLWWGGLILIIGAISSLLGVLYALTEHDIKRLLAYHSIENIGIILLGLGGSLAFLSLGKPSLATLALIAALFHTLNHAIFKSLLFMGAGAVISQTHTRNMEEYGGLIKYMPHTALFFLIGSLAISALPPFNGFASEWMTFQSLFGGILGVPGPFRFVFILSAGSLAFTGGLAAACFVKAFGATFLARPRGESVPHARETDRFSQIGMAALATLTLVVGVFAGKMSGVLAGVAGSLDSFATAPQPLFDKPLGVFAATGFASFSPQLIFLSLLSAVLITFLVARLFTEGRRVRIARTWDCGADLSPRMEITATAFSRSLIVIFSGILKPTKQTHVEYRDADLRYFPRSSAVLLGFTDVYASVYGLLQTLLVRVSEYVKKIQSGNINVYVLYVFITLVILLIFSAL